MPSGAYIRLILGRAVKAIEKADRASIDGTGLNASDFSILEALLHKGPLPINTIGEKVLLTSGSMTAAANRLAAKGLIERIQDPADGRCFNLHLTDLGRRTIQHAFEKHARNLETITGVLTAPERDELVRLLKKLGRHAQILGQQPS